MQTGKYLVATPRDLLWGLTVSTVGREDSAPGESYPSPNHPDGYFFHPERGRTFNEYQMLYIHQGGGHFLSAHGGEHEVRPGDVFRVFPNEWHTYAPDPKTGWQGYWIGFKGQNIDARVRAGFFTPQEPVSHVGFSAELVRLYEEALRVANEEAAFHQQMLAGIVNHMIGLVYTLERTLALGHQGEQVDMIQRARLRIRQTLEENVSIQMIANEMGVGYSNFRKLFKEHTGLSPFVFQQDLKLQRAKELLSTTQMSVKEIAYRLGFDSPDYFSQKFKMKVGVKPSDFR